MTKYSAKDWLDNDGTRYNRRTDSYEAVKRPDSLVVLTKDAGGGYPVYMYKGEHGLARVSAGCRDFSLEAADVHWHAVRNAERGDGSSQRYQRADHILRVVLPKARRSAKTRGWNAS